MATHELSIGLGQPDASGEVYLSILGAELTLTNAKRQHCMVIQPPSASDPGCELVFRVPQNYVGTPVLVIRGVISGTPGSSTLAFGAQQLSRADSEIVDTAYEAEDTASNSTWTGYVDEDEYEETITLTPAAAYVVGDMVYLLVYRDDSADDHTMDFLATGFFFRYSDV